MITRIPGAQYRAFDVDGLAMQLRGVDDNPDGPDRLVGHAAVFNVWSDPFWGFKERIAPGAFARAIIEDDVRALWNHETGLILGRKKADTLELKEDDTGLAVVIFPPDTQAGRDAIVSIERKDVDQMSFAFRAITEEWSFKEDEDDERTITEVRLYEVSPVTFPAYTDTDIHKRSGSDLRELHEKARKEFEARCAQTGRRERLLRHAERGFLVDSAELRERQAR